MRQDITIELKADGQKVQSFCMIDVYGTKLQGSKFVLYNERSGGRGAS